MIIDEPVRGQIPPSWFWALSGSERLEAIAEGLIPLPPMCRLFGIRPGHVGPASGTWTIPASPWLQNSNPALETEVLAVAAMQGVGMSVLPPGRDLRIQSLSMNYFRPARAQPGNLLARARVVNANPFFLFVTVGVEDPEGRQIMEGGAHAAIVPVEPEPPSPPLDLVRVEEARYATPDPYLRNPTGGVIPDAEIQRRGGLEPMQDYCRKGMGSPMMDLMGARFEHVEIGEVSVRLTASPWFGMYRNEMDPAAMAEVLSWATLATGTSRIPPGHSLSGSSIHAWFYRPIPADGRSLRIESSTLHTHENRFEGEGRLLNAEGELAARFIASGQIVEASRRRKPRTAPVKRALYSLLFTDIVDSTRHLERLGDAKWRETLAEQQKKIRAEIARCGGTEIDTQGDSFFVRFNSPAQAIACARAARDAVKTLGLEIRAGAHIGECEEHGNDLAGLAVHLAARIQGKAGAGEIWVSNTLKELVAGSGLRFADRGEHELKGIEGTWRLWALEG